MESDHTCNSHPVNKEANEEEKLVVFFLLNFLIDWWYLDFFERLFNLNWSIGIFAKSILHFLCAPKFRPHNNYSNLPRIECVIALMQAGCSGRNLSTGTCDATLWGIPCAWYTRRWTIARTANRATICCIQIAADTRVRRTGRWTNWCRTVLARIWTRCIPYIFVAVCVGGASGFGTIFIVGSVV